MSTENNNGLPYTIIYCIYLNNDIKNDHNNHSGIYLVKNNTTNLFEISDISLKTGSPSASLILHNENFDYLFKYLIDEYMKSRFASYYSCEVHGEYLAIVSKKFYKIDNPVLLKKINESDLDDSFRFNIVYVREPKNNFELLNWNQMQTLLKVQAASQ